MEPVNVLEYEALAREKLPKEAYDFIAGGAEDEVTVAENRAAFQRIFIRPRVLVDVTSVDTATNVLGQRISFPVLLAPVGGQGLAHPDADVASARAAAGAETIFALSTTSSCSIEEVAAASASPKWFQLYMYGEGRDGARRLVERAEQAGYRAICVTGDSNRQARRERDMRNQAEIRRLEVSAKNLIDQPPGSLTHRSRTWDDIDWLRSSTSLPIIIKGVMTAKDARLSVEHGAAAIIVSNHGGRQLDGVPATVDVLEEVAEAAAGRAEVLLDGGVRRGTDVLKALALGASAVLIGRPFVWGLAVAGEAGVSRVLGLLREEVETAMALAGCRSVQEIDRSFVRRAGGSWSDRGASAVHDG